MCICWVDSIMTGSSLGVADTAAEVNTLHACRLFGFDRMHSLYWVLVSSDRNQSLEPITSQPI